MVLEVGKIGKARFIRFVKKTNIFECGDNGMVFERENKELTLYATNAACSKIYAVIPMGTDKNCEKRKFTAIAYNDHVMLLDAGETMVVIDYDAEKVAVSDPGIKVTGKGWEDVQAPWDPAYGRMFGIYND